jgi:hypothetical protein
MRSDRCGQGGLEQDTKRVDGDDGDDGLSRGRGRKGVSGS